MSVLSVSHDQSRFSDICDEPVDYLLAPIKGFNDKPALPLMEAVKLICAFFDGLEDYVKVALYNCQNPRDGLTQDESAAIHLYTMEFSSGPSLYTLLNQSLRSENRPVLKPWYPYLKLFITGLYKLPVQNIRVWRGIRNVDLSSKYKRGYKFAWWGVSSCTSDIEVLNSDQFLGQTGVRTLFSIDTINGRSVANHSYFKNIEKEITLLPGSFFEVMGQLKPAPDLFIIELKEISPPATLFEPPTFYKPININSPPTVGRKPSIISRIGAKIRTKSMSSVGSAEGTLTQLDATWKSFGVTICGGNGRGNQSHQLYCPHSIFIDNDEQTMYIADSQNHRIIQRKFNSRNIEIIAGGNRPGSQLDQLNNPTDIIIDKQNNCLIISDRGNRRVIQWSRLNNTRNGQTLIDKIDCYGLAIDQDGSIYVSDYEKHEVKRWKKGDKNGTIVAGGHGSGSRLNQLKHPTFIFIDQDYSLYISDRDNHRVVKWTKDAKEGIIVAGGFGSGNNFTQLSSPNGITVDHLGQIFVTDWDNHRVMAWSKDANEGIVVLGTNQEGQQANQFSNPIALTFDQQRNLYVVDCLNHRIQKFDFEQTEHEVED